MSVDLISLDVTFCFAGEGFDVNTILPNLCVCENTEELTLFWRVLAEKIICDSSTILFFPFKVNSNSQPNSCLQSKQNNKTFSSEKKVN